MRVQSLWCVIGNTLCSLADALVWRRLGREDHRNAALVCRGPRAVADGERLAGCGRGRGQQEGAGRRSRSAQAAAGDVELDSRGSSWLTKSQNISASQDAAHNSNCSRFARETRNQCTCWRARRRRLQPCGGRGGFT